jgi:ribosomal protein L11 methylase PrmA
MTSPIDGASFRDPSGFVFRSPDGVLLRQVNRSYEPHYRALVDSGLYDELVSGGLLVRHDEEPLSRGLSADACAVLRPHQIPFISHPYEWSFSQLQAAALLTLDIHARAFKRGMVLKDSSAFNVQFEGTRPVFIDTLSFETYREGEPWVAYRQFCGHFLAPLALMRYVDPEQNGLLRLYIDGVPLPLASRLLPKRTWAMPRLLTHIHLHAQAQQRYAPTEKVDGSNPGEAARKPPRVSRMGMQGIIDSLRNTVRKLQCPPAATAWSDYYDTNAYTAESGSQKAGLVDKYLAQVTPKTVWDLGANTGVYSRIAAKHAAVVVAMDSDWGCVEANFHACTEEGMDRILPLRVDLTNPSPSIGWAHKERLSLVERGPADLAMALALIHHLAIGNNVPLERLGAFMRDLCRHLIIEFVPKDDPQTQRLLQSRRDIFDAYTREAFEAAFGEYFVVLDSQPLPDSRRVLYLMETRR